MHSWRSTLWYSEGLSGALLRFSGVPVWFLAQPINFLRRVLFVRTAPVELGPKILHLAWLLVESRNFPGTGSMDRLTTTLNKRKTTPRRKNSENSGKHPEESTSVVDRPSKTPIYFRPINWVPGAEKKKKVAHDSWFYCRSRSVLRCVNPCLAFRWLLGCEPMLAFCFSSAVCCTRSMQLQYVI